jgi:DNA-binding Xre family transcriptional regulator
MQGMNMVKSRLKAIIYDYNARRLDADQSPLTIREIAAAAKVAPSTLTGMTANRHHNISYDTLDKLCKFFNLQPGDFFDYKP